jgi:hypothetical protein
MSGEFAYRPGGGCLASTPGEPWIALVCLPSASGNLVSRSTILSTSIDLCHRSVELVGHSSGPKTWR